MDFQKALYQSKKNFFLYNFIFYIFYHIIFSIFITFQQKKSLEICTRKRINEIDCVADENFENLVNLYIKNVKIWSKFKENFQFSEKFPEISSVKIPRPPAGDLSRGRRIEILPRRRGIASAGGESPGGSPGAPPVPIPN